MQTLNDDLAIPAFLRPTGPPQKFKTRRWSRIPKVPKPEGERYEDAERYEVFIESTKRFLPELAGGLRKLWVAEAEDGSRKVYLHDGEHEASLPMAEWGRMAVNARRIA